MSFKFKKVHIKILITLIVIIHILLLVFWILFDPTTDLLVYTPGMDKDSNAMINLVEEEVIIGEHYKKISNINTDLTGKWTRFRGSNHLNIIKYDKKIKMNWEKNDPELIWSIPTGEGHAAPVIYNGLVYFLDYDENLRADKLRCLSLKTGEEIWERWYHVKLKRNHGLSRTIPAVTEKYIVSIGPKGHVMCLQRETGNFLWGIDLEKKYNTVIPDWYTGQCALIDEGNAIIGVGGSSLLTAVNCETGNIIWETENPKQWKMSHSSILPVNIEGKKMYIYAALGGICGISAEGEDIGEILWENSNWAPNVVAPSPVLIDQNKIYMTAGYGAGATVIEIRNNNGKFTANTLIKYEPKEGPASEQQTPVLYNNHLYCILPKDAGLNRNQFVCYNINNLNTPVWQSGKTERFGLGPYIIINDKILILNDEGTLSMIEASDKRFKLISRKKVFDGHDAWGPFAFADGYLLLRDSKNIYCLDLRL